MEVDANVWAKQSESGTWFRATVLKIEKTVVQKKNLTRFTVQRQDRSGFPTGAQ
eukprot:gene53742-71825_t